MVESAIGQSSGDFFLKDDFRESISILRFRGSWVSMVKISEVKCLCEKRPDYLVEKFLEKVTNHLKKYL